MILYHTSDREIINPDIHYGRKNADFGWGFYLTPDREFTYRWAGYNAVVNKYEFDEEGLDVCVFKRDAAWFEYIFNNRRAKDGLSADVIKGPIANDTIFDTLGILTSGLLKPEEALSMLEVGPEYVQVAIKTEKAAKKLLFIGAEKIEKAEADVLKKEQDAYQREFARKFESIMSH
ncbi:MAG: DUF3990 domain-containing protein [Lachnospiraceae bacterium]|nr:DUF3990 domain-containing protein [Lachnospiraceae bacterium]